jgi:hypothetical protein
MLESANGGIAVRALDCMDWEDIQPGDRNHPANNTRGNVVTYLWWAIDSAVIRRIGRWFERLSARRQASLYHDWDLELTEAEAERENWEPDELWAAITFTMAQHGG